MIIPREWNFSKKLNDTFAEKNFRFFRDPIFHAGTRLEILLANERNRSILFSMYNNIDSSIRQMQLFIAFFFFSSRSIGE